MQHIIKPLEMPARRDFARYAQRHTRYTPG